MWQQLITTEILQENINYNLHWYQNYLLRTDQNMSFLEGAEWQVMAHLESAPLDEEETMPPAVSQEWGKAGWAWHLYLI